MKEFLLDKLTIIKTNMSNKDMAEEHNFFDLDQHLFTKHIVIIIHIELPFPRNLESNNSLIFFFIHSLLYDNMDMKKNYVINLII